MTTDSNESNAASRRTLTIAAALITVATALGAFGTHALQPILSPQRFANYSIAVNYQFFNALGLLGVGLAQRLLDSAWLRWSIRLLLLGVLLFCGSVYAISFGLPSWIATAAPLGGTSLMVAWIIFAIAMWRGRRLA